MKAKEAREMMAALQQERVENIINEALERLGHTRDRWRGKTVWHILDYCNLLLPGPVPVDWHRLTEADLEAPIN